MSELAAPKISNVNVKTDNAATVITDALVVATSSDCLLYTSDAADLV